LCAGCRVPRCTLPVTLTADDATQVWGNRPPAPPRPRFDWLLHGLCAAWVIPVTAMGVWGVAQIVGAL
jgi:hypothetical protein